MLMQLNTVQWISLPIETRHKLVDIFDIPRSGNTEVEGNTIVTDGYTHQDLSVITIEKMQGFLLDTVTDNYFDLFHRVLDVINEVVKPELEETKPEESKQVEIINTNDEKNHEQTKKTKQDESSNPKRVGSKSRTKSKESKS